MSILKSSQKIQHFYHTFYRNVYQHVTNIKNEVNTQKKTRTISSSFYTIEICLNLFL